MLFSTSKSSTIELCKVTQLPVQTVSAFVLLGGFHFEMMFLHRSYGQVLCASTEDHTVVEPLIPPEGAKVGERILFAGFDGKPEDVLNPKKKQLDKITPHLRTDENGIATFNGIPFTTSAGPCRSSIPNANVK
uniref:Uncharacterized protein n=1 Tax=Arundo donax TaxID=35708 RepID=A0A0A9AEQ6_ARUDO